MERVIDCPICYDTDACFEDIQEKFKSYMCFNCGFMSSSYYKKDTVKDDELPKPVPAGTSAKVPKCHLFFLKNLFFERITLIVGWLILLIFETSSIVL